MKGLNGWIRQLEGNQSAVMSTLLKELERLTECDRSSGMEVGEVILRDANLTSNIIRVGNSAMFNASTIPVTTVSRAILNIGFKQLRSIVVSIKLLDAVLNENPSDLLIARLANSLHAAAQAKSLVSDKKPSVQEEVYVATLLSNLTELLVLASAESDAKSFSAELNSTMELDEKNSKAEKTLGVSISRLAKTLMKRWRIEGLVNDVLLDLKEKDELQQAIWLGSEVSRCAQFGWDSPELRKVLEEVAEFKGRPFKDVIKEVKGVAEVAEESVKQYGNVALQGQIVSGSPVGAELNQGAQADSNKDSSEKALLAPNPEFQLKALQELTMLLSGDFNINRVFKTVLIGLNKGVGLERCCMAVFDKTHLKLVAKYVQGDDTKAWNESFVVNYTKSEQGFLYQLFKLDQSAWVGSSEFSALADIVPNEYKGITGADDFFVAPLIAQGRRIGIIYADMGNSGRSLSPVLFDGFKMFIQQAKLALTVLAAKSG